MSEKPKIPIQNVYYLLAYAWDYFREGQVEDISAVDCPDSVNLLAKILATGITGLTTRGMDKNYVLVREDTPKLRGRFDLIGSYRRGIYLAGKLNCEFDELTSDTLPNQILKTTCRRLLRSYSGLSKNNRADVNRASELLRDISEVHLTPRVFRRVQLHRNNRHYRLLLNICELLNQCFTPSERQGQGRFADFLHNDRVMNRVFERFVLRFSRRHCRGARVHAMKIKWDGRWDSEVEKVLPGMETDVTIDYPTSKTILDCKFYRQALVTRHDKERLHSGHLYQLTAYLQNKAKQTGWENARGVLLYPAVDHHLKLQFELLGFPIEIQSIDLDQPWQVIESKLLSIVRA